MPIQAPGRKDIEEKADVDSLAQLQQERREIMRRLTPLRAKYGSFGTIDALRKQYVEALRQEALNTLTAQNGKTPPEWIAEASAYGSEKYKSFIENWENQRIEWINLETQVTEIEEKIRSREIELRAYSAETMLGR